MPPHSRFDLEGRVAIITGGGKGIGAAAAAGALLGLAGLICASGFDGLIFAVGYATGLPIQMPMIDIQEVGTGGGSIAESVDGRLKVGPQSAGSFPGPACYGRGGAQPAVTDADMVCGYLNPDYFLGGSQRLDVEASRQALKTHIADPLQMDVLAAAAGIRRIVDMRRIK